MNVAKADENCLVALIQIMEIADQIMSELCIQVERENPEIKLLRVADSHPTASAPANRPEYPAPGCSARSRCINAGQAGKQPLLGLYFLSEFLFGL
jgi:hypothetical protein